MLFNLDLIRKVVHTKFTKKNVLILAAPVNCTSNPFYESKRTQKIGWFRRKYYFEIFFMLYILRKGKKI